MYPFYQIHALNEALLAKSKFPFADRLVASESQSFEGPEKNKLVLIVDDEEAIADSLAEILNTFGYQSRAFYNGEQAIEFAHQQCPDVVLLDVLMPGLDGVETALRIRELCPYARILLFSARPMFLKISCTKHGNKDRNSNCWPSLFILKSCSGSCRPSSHS
jgi:CheY-like chemotaxis protein